MRSLSNAQLEKRYYQNIRDSWQNGLDTWTTATEQRQAYLQCGIEYLNKVMDKFQEAHDNGIEVPTKDAARWAGGRDLYDGLKAVGVWK